MKKKNKETRFKVGQTVYHMSTGVHGIVVETFVSEKADGTFFEHRYNVKHSGETWSVPERYLASRKPRQSNDL